MKKILYVFCIVFICSLTCFAAGKKNKQNQNLTIDTIMTRTSVRQYSDKKVEQEKIDTILKAAMAAPSGTNKQPWEILVITDKEKLKNVAEVAPNARYAENSQLTIIVCGDTNISEKLWMQDCCAVTENILLAAHALDLGAVWCMAYPSQERINDLQKLFNLPENVVPLSIIPVGYPSGTITPKQKYNADKVHLNGWSRTEK